MSIYRNVPEIADAKSGQELLDKSREIIKWGNLNLPEIRRAKSIGRMEGLTTEDVMDISLALMIKSYVAAMEGWHEMAQLSPVVLAGKEGK